MGKRSGFERKAHDFYVTPAAAVAPLLPWLARDGIKTFAEPCAGDGALVRLLEGHGYAVMQATDGEGALSAARVAAPDLVLTDVMMPRLNGIELLRMIRNDTALAGTPATGTTFPNTPASITAPPGLGATAAATAGTGIPVWLRMAGFTNTM